MGRKLVRALTWSCYGHRTDALVGRLIELAIGSASVELAAGLLGLARYSGCLGEIRIT